MNGVRRQWFGMPLPTANRLVDLVDDSFYHNRAEGDADEKGDDDIDGVVECDLKHPGINMTVNAKFTILRGEDVTR